MKNISFDNPLWLLLAIPLLAAIIVPFFIARSKDNRSPRWVASLVLHIVMTISVTFAAAGLTHTTVITRTKVYILADLSYSSNRNLDEIDEYIGKVADALPSNSRLGIVCFGNDFQVLTSSGEQIRSVKEAKIDDSGTNIAQAIDEVSTYFSEGEIKRIVLITDGYATTTEGATAAAIERAAARDIKIDAIYLDNNLKEGEEEVQISEVKYTKSTYLHHENSASVMVESNVENDVILTLSVREEGTEEYAQIDKTVLTADVGVNMVSFALPTDVSGVFEYRVDLTATKDISGYNNSYSFTQTVAGKQNVLLVTGNSTDPEMFMNLYGESATLSPYVINARNKDIPYTVEALSQYDEIIVSNVDIRQINNINAFIDSADAVISQYGKSLITFGDLHMQNTDDEVFAKFEELLPVSFGNANKDAKLYTIVLDVSRSMQFVNFAQIRLAKDAACKLASILNDDDYISIVTLSGESRVVVTPTRLGDCREELENKIQSLALNQGTFIGDALNMAYELMRPLDSFEEKQVMLISDGKTYTHEEEDALTVAEKMKDADITLSTVLVMPHGENGAHTQQCSYMNQLATAGGGIPYELTNEYKLADLVFSEIGDTITESIIEGKTQVTIQNYHDDTMEGIMNIPSVYGYVNSKAKLDANMILSVDYQKNSKTTVQVPLYAYREHGNGRVATFTSDLSGDWLKDWGNALQEQFFGNVLTTNTPRERIDYPYELAFEHFGDRSTVTISPTYPNPRAKAQIKVTTPTGETIEQQLVFDLNKYETVFDTQTVGRYHIEITYSYGTNVFTSTTYYTVPYGPEYDAFAVYDVGNIHDFMRGVGQVSTDGKLNLENDKTEIATYQMDFQAPLLIFAVVLFVIDVFVRKFGWKDIKGFFRKSHKLKEKKKKE